MRNVSVAYGVLGRGCKVSALVAIVSSVFPATAEEIGILALGDSLTQGYGLLQEEGFVPQLEAALIAAGHDVAVFNAGVSGDTTAGGLSRVEWSLNSRVDAMIVALGGNDLLRGLPPELSRDNLAGILQIAEAADVDVLLVGLEAPGNYGPEYQAAFNAMYPELAAEYGVLHAESFFMGFGTADPAEISELMQFDGIHPNADGVARIVEGLLPSVESLIARVEGEP